MPGQNCAATVFHVWSQKPATLLQSFPPHDSTLASTWSILGGALGGDALGGGALGGGKGTTIEIKVVEVLETAP